MSNHIIERVKSTGIGQYLPTNFKSPEEVQCWLEGQGYVVVETKELPRSSGVSLTSCGMVIYANGYVCVSPRLETSQDQEASSRLQERGYTKPPVNTVNNFPNETVTFSMSHRPTYHEKKHLRRQARFERHYGTGWRMVCLYSPPNGGLDAYYVHNFNLDELVTMMDLCEDWLSYKKAVMEKWECYSTDLLPNYRPQEVYVLRRKDRS